MGLDIYLRWPGITATEREAQITGFENVGAAGYLRSSYNDSGFDSWADRYLDGHGLSWIFGYNESEEVETLDEDGEKQFLFYPDWNQARKRAKLALRDARKLDRLVVVRTPTPHAVLPRGGALARYRERLAEQKKGGPFESFLSGDGLWNFGEPFMVRAVVQERGYVGYDICLICEPKENPHRWYIEMLEKHVLPFIETGQSKKAGMVWSG